MIENLLRPSRTTEREKKIKSKVGTGMKKELNRTMHQWRGVGVNLWMLWGEKKLKIMLSKVDYLIGSIYMFGMNDAG